mmetsp:Transcript_10179/g.28632  ORF Transcript_10179/g.28632 Transcript_10179/m.28632 type:complete len:519 (+) Transcript_10179:100-1656(+)
MGKETTDMEVEGGKEGEEAKAELEVLLAAELRQHIGQLITVVKATDLRGVERVVAKTCSFRRRVGIASLRALVEDCLEDDASRVLLLQSLQTAEGAGDAMDVSGGGATTDTAMGEAGDENNKAVENAGDMRCAVGSAAYPEVNTYLHLLVLIFLLDRQVNDEAVKLAASVAELVRGESRHTMAAIAVKAYFYYSRAFELVGRLREARAVLMAAQRTARNRQEKELHASLENLLLWNFLHYNQYDAADHLVAHSHFDEGAVSSNQHARYLYYTGRIRAIQLHYKEAAKKLALALRKAPQGGALGFRVTVTKLLVTVELLTGQIPDRTIFNQHGFRKALLPYYRFALAVRQGDVRGFQAAFNEHLPQLQADKTDSLIQRLHHSVIKAGLRKINVAYSCITIRDICTKLGLGDEADAEFMVAKAIRDDVIEGTILQDAEAGAYLKSKDVADVYVTQQPQDAFHDRIQFFLNVRNDAVKAMRFPDKQYKVAEETEEERKERVQAEMEIPKILEEAEDDDDEI